MAQVSTKRFLIDKANLTIVIVTAVTVSLTIFSLVSSYYLLQQRSYQAKVISKKQKAKDILEANKTSRDQLVQQYKVFVEKDPNAIGGIIDGTSDKDGDNGKIILDALPSIYDYPALVTSLDKLVRGSGVSLTTLNATDTSDEQTAAASGTPVMIPFELSAQGGTEQTRQLLVDLQRSIRPIAISKVTLTSASDGLAVTISANTYYQPETKLEVKEEVVR